MGNTLDLIENTYILLELISDYNKVARHKFNTQKSIVFLCTSNEQAEFKIENLMPFISPPLKLRYLGTKSNIYMKKTIKFWWRKQKKN